MTILQYILTTSLFFNQTLLRTYNTLEKQLKKCMSISWYQMVTLQYKPFITKSINCTYTFLSYHLQYIVVYTVWTMPALIYRCYVTQMPSVYTINVGNTWKASLLEQFTTNYTQQEILRVIYCLVKQMEPSEFKVARLFIVCYVKSRTMYHDLFKTLLCWLCNGQCQ